MTFDDTEIEEDKFHYYKSPISINDKYTILVVSNKLPFGKQDFKYFIAYKNVRPLCILFPKYKRYFDKPKYTYFIIEEETFLINI